MKIVINRDVVFDEKGTWSWNQNGVKEGIPADFDDEEIGQQPMENEQEDEVTQNVPTDQSSLTAESQKPQRVRRTPTWMIDYEVTGVDQGDDPLTHFALFSYCDPIIFEAAVKEPKSR